MQPTAAPWARPPGDLPPVAKGETTVAPWSPAGSGLTGKPVEAAIQAHPAVPSPATPEDSDWATHQFVPAIKRITNSDMLQRFLGSQTASDFVAFILALNESVKGRQLSDACQMSGAMQALLGALDTLWAWVDEIPAAQHSLRYGNPAFRTWFARMSQQAPALLASVLPPALQPALVELVPYFVDSFGNSTRIDYGTGHETTFCALLYCLARLGLLQAADSQAAVTRVFARYLSLMRKVQTTYWLEPAGSHGVWGLDDYQFLPFLWGAAQLIDHPSIKPSGIHSAELLETYGDKYLYLGCVRFVKQVKKGPLSETSPMLNDISGVPSWSKVNSGMVKMYQVEVLSKLPIMQHFLFGSLLPFNQTPAMRTARPGHTTRGHDHLSSMLAAASVRDGSPVTGSQPTAAPASTDWPDDSNRPG